MQAPDPIEAALARLMPTAMSVSGQRSIEDMLDELAAGMPVSPARRYRRPLFGFGLAAAAAIAGILAVPALMKPAGKPSFHPGSIVNASSITPALSIVEESNRVESMADEGWVSGADGGAMQAVRVRVVGENTLRDRETGCTVHVSEPREELLLMPVSSF